MTLINIVRGEHSSTNADCGDIETCGRGLLEPDKQVSRRQVHCLARLANILLPKFHYRLITDCSSGMRTQR